MQCLILFFDIYIQTRDKLVNTLMEAFDEIECILHMSSCSKMNSLNNRYTYIYNMHDPIRHIIKQKCYDG
jgi:hypothetical protein